MSINEKKHLEETSGNCCSEAQLSRRKARRAFTRSRLVGQEIEIAQSHLTRIRQASSHFTSIASHSGIHRSK